MSVIELGSGTAYSMFSSKDWKEHGEVIQNLEKNQLADSREYWLDLENQKFWMIAYKNGQLVKVLVLSSTKAKMKNAIKDFKGMEG